MNDDAPPPAANQLWYCQTCTKLINPPFSTGIVDLAGHHFCAACAPIESRATDRVKLDSPASRNSSRSLIPAPRLDSPSPPASSDSSKRTLRFPMPPPQRHAIKLILAVGIFVVGLLLFVAVLLSPGRGGTPSLAASPAVTSRLTPPANPVELPAQPTPVIPPVNPAPTPSVSPGIEPSPAAPVPAPVALAPVPLAASTVRPEDQQKQVLDGLKSASEQSAALKFSSAAKQLASLKESFEKSPGWDQFKAPFESADKALQSQLSAFEQEAADAIERAQKSEALPELTDIEAHWKKKINPAPEQPPSVWEPLEILSMNTSSGATLTPQPDGSILVGGINPPKDTYTLVLKSILGPVTALRLELLPDPSFHNNGPGRAGHGNVALSKISLFAASDSAPLQPVPIVNPTALYEQLGTSIAHTLDNDPNSHWAMMQDLGKRNVAVLPAAAPVGGADGVRFNIVLDFQTGFERHALGRFRFSTTRAAPPPDAKNPASASAPAPALDEALAKPLRQILKAVADSRARVEEKARQKRLAEWSQQLDSLEKQLKSKPRHLDAFFKTLDDLDTAFLQDSSAGEKCVERSAALRFDAATLKDGEFSFYKLPLKQSGAVVELFYDFSKPEQFTAWTLDNPDNSGSADYDAKSAAVILRASGKRNWDKRDRRNTPLLRLPFYFQRDNWAFAARANLQSDTNQKNKPDYGILIWDGAGGSIRLSIKDATPKDVVVMLNGSTPKEENIAPKPLYLSGRPRDSIHLQMTCVNGLIACVATSPSGKIITLNGGKEPIGFEPRFAGLFVRTHEDGEQAAVQFDSVKLLALPNREKLKEIQESTRKEALLKARMDFAKNRAK